MSKQRKSKPARRSRGQVSKMPKPEFKTREITIKNQDGSTSTKTLAEIPATEEDFLAVSLHSERDESNRLRHEKRLLQQTLLEKEKEIAELTKRLADQSVKVANLTLEAAQARVDRVTAEIQKAAKANEILRATRGISAKATIDKDDKTNAINWLVDVEDEDEMARFTGMFSKNRSSTKAPPEESYEDPEPDVEVQEPEPEPATSEV